MKKINLLWILPLLTACQHTRTYFDKHIEPLPVSIIRFDEALMNVSRQTVTTDVQVLYDEYDAFMPVFVENILGLPVEDTTYLCQALPDFLEDTTYGFAETNQRVKLQFSDMKDIETELGEGFARLLTLYPDIEIPTLYAMISGFNASIYFFNDPETDDVNIAIGTDMYLGSDYEYYNRVVYDYQKRTMRRECIAADVLSAYLFHSFPYTGTKNRLLDNMIYRGKLMYLLAQLLPGEQAYEIMGYTRDQWDWCIRYERDVWNMMMDKRDLFKTENLVLTGYLNDGPFTSEISQEAPARLGTWIGWRIVQSYMEHNTNINLQQLIDEQDAQLILENSYYRP